jgi:hypothetical protein
MYSLPVLLLGRLSLYSINPVIFLLFNFFIKKCLCRNPANRRKGLSPAAGICRKSPDKKPGTV